MYLESAFWRQLRQEFEAEPATQVAEEMDGNTLVREFMRALLDFSTSEVTTNVERCSRRLQELRAELLCRIGSSRDGG